jgi:hypothetical protein
MNIEGARVVILCGGIEAERFQVRKKDRLAVSLWIDSQEQEVKTILVARDRHSGHGGRSAARCAVVTSPRRPYTKVLIALCQSRN